ncbi:MAG: Asp-tRNA(Asn)/Glu-tRNA(Gln) amidotransferase subunit GatC [Sporomusaceae bacterium]|jgi:aspartyl-tRNA(Asn)/glutamyl-tRNA(Gln) amidotransferase subunit C|nr:Asp-tRNA(Asn)/Glu-tRNA(Gln) amidotransferase subunit GatC [Sporomusaceae bacterium]
MLINDDLIAYLEELSCLSFADEEKLRLQGDLSEILGYMARLSGLATENVPECSHPFANVNAFREDMITPSWQREMILKNAPEKTAEMFIAPKTVE